MIRVLCGVHRCDIKLVLSSDQPMEIMISSHNSPTLDRNEHVLPEPNPSMDSKLAGFLCIDKLCLEHAEN
jgi:hypothetical protein